MSISSKCLRGGLVCVLCVAGAAAQAQTLITDFSFFTSNALYASWGAPETIIDSGDSAYTITATGYGSNYAFIGGLGVIGAGNTHLELEVGLSGPPAADGQLGPIVTLLDADGTRYNYAWYGQTLGDHVLRTNINAPTWVDAVGTTPGLDLDLLQHMHMQLDPAMFGASGAYTISWKNLALITAAPGDFDGDTDVDGADFLTWQRNPAVGALADWTANFPKPPGAVLAASVVPEPSSWVMLAVMGAGVALRRRRKQ
jgi:hypothetical protein